MATGALRVGRDITADERRTAVLRAALTAIAAVGYETVRLRDVARESGLSVGALQHHFETRDDLVAQAFQQASDDLLRGWADTLSTDLSPWERIEALVTHLVERDSLRDRCLIWVEFGAAAARHDVIREAFGAVNERWAEIVRTAVHDGTATGDFNPRLPQEVVVEVLLEQIDGGILSVASGLGRVDGRRLRASTLALAGALLDHRVSAPAD